MEVVELLLKHGAKPGLRKRFGSLAVSLVFRLGSVWRESWQYVQDCKLDGRSVAGARDRLGNTPAHVIPLYADEITLKLLSLLANDAKHLRRKQPVTP